jgi:hypothetical protein
MERLKKYLLDCENKRRRMRNRPSNEVLEQLRKLLEQHDEQLEDSRSSPTPNRPLEAPG